jgi:hypothetical protein
VIDSIDENDSVANKNTQPAQGPLTSFFPLMGKSALDGEIQLSANYFAIRTSVRQWIYVLNVCTETTQNYFLRCCSANQSVPKSLA